MGEVIDSCEQVVGKGVDEATQNLARVRERLNAMLCTRLAVSNWVRVQLPNLTPYEWLLLQLHQTPSLAPPLSAWITRPSVCSERLMLAASCRCLPAKPLCFCRSDPARSIGLIFAHRVGRAQQVLADARLRVKTSVRTAWLRFDVAFMLVAATVRALLPAAIRRSTSARLVTSTCVRSHTYGPVVGCSRTRRLLLASGPAPAPAQPPPLLQSRPRNRARLAAAPTRPRPPRDGGRRSWIPAIPGCTTRTGRALRIVGHTPVSRDTLARRGTPAFLVGSSRGS